jgi:hypothetical protein
MLKLTLLSPDFTSPDCWVSAPDIIYITTDRNETTIGLSSGAVLRVAEPVDEIVSMLTERAADDYEQ